MFSFLSSGNMPVLRLCKGPPIVNRFALPILSVKAYSKTHPRNPSSPSTCLIVCTRPYFARILVQPKNI